jgi:hypothetical protein
MDGDRAPHVALELDSLPFGLSAKPTILKVSVAMCVR